jgi:uncharacterized membrane protein
MGLRAGGWLDRRRFDVLRPYRGNKLGQECRSNRSDGRARDDRSPPVADILILMANVASLVAVGYLIVQGHSTHGARQALLAGLAVVSVAVSWALVHTLYMLRYAVLYYSGEVGGINFNQPESPSFIDFAYLAFTIGMTYQVSDTNLETRRIRIAALGHALQSFVFGSVILATVVNLVAGLSG